MDVNNLVSASPIVKYGSTTVTYSPSASGPANGDLWNEPGSRYPGPWEWEASTSRWYSPPVDILFPIETNVTATTRRRSATEFYNSQYGTGAATKLCFVNIFIAGGAAAHSATNYFSFNIEYLLGSGVVTNLLTTTDSTLSLGANGLRRINQVTSSYFPGNAWTIGYRALLNGTGVSIAELSVKITVKYPRP